MSTTDRPALSQVCVLIPTYNERENLAEVIARVREAEPRLDVLILDDNSPDGTGQLADRLAEDDPRVHVLHRAGKEGLGKAYLAGFAWAQQHGYDAVIEMDADGSHLPEQLERLLAAGSNADVVIGSRWVQGGAIHQWPWHRRALSSIGNRYARVMLALPVRDATAGFRLYRCSTLHLLDLEDVASQGYCFQVDLTVRAVARGARVVEVPIDFVEREWGESKMDSHIVAEALVRVTQWGIVRRLGQLTGRVGTAEGTHSLAQGSGSVQSQEVAWQQRSD